MCWQLSPTQVKGSRCAPFDVSLSLTTCVISPRRSTPRRICHTYTLGHQRSYPISQVNNASIPSIKTDKSSSALFSDSPLLPWASQFAQNPTGTLPAKKRPISEEQPRIEICI